jgi:hypothetical protein
MAAAGFTAGGRSVLGDFTTGVSVVVVVDLEVAHVDAIVSQMTNCAAAYKTVSLSFVKCGSTPKLKMVTVYIISSIMIVFASGVH